MASLTYPEKNLVRDGKKYTVMAQLWAPTFEALSGDLVEDPSTLGESEREAQNLICEFIDMLPVAEKEKHKDAGNWNHVSFCLVILLNYSLLYVVCGWNTRPSFSAWASCTKTSSPIHLRS
jgi:hypothetical protein